jgi:hypothetical protein
MVGRVTGKVKVHMDGIGVYQAQHQLGPKLLTFLGIEYHGSSALLARLT